MKRLQIVGAGWAGLSAAVYALRAGWQVDLYDTAHTVGGRARTLQSGGALLDNGQHVLVGACQQTLELMQHVGIDVHQVLRRLPLQLSDVNQHHAQWMRHRNQFRQLLGLMMDHQKPWSNRWYWLKCLWVLKHCRPRDWQALTVQNWLDEHAPADLRRWLEVLCISALNCPAHLASASVFLSVLQESFKTPHGSDVLIPVANLSDLLPSAALTWLERMGAHIHLGQRIMQLEPLMVRGHVILACAAKESARLTQTLAPDWSAMNRRLSHNAIATVYTQWPDSGPCLQSALIFLPSDFDTPAQVIVDHGQLTPHRLGLWAWVISYAQGERPDLLEGVLQQAQSLWGQQPKPVQVLLERRATFQCAPGVQRPPAQVCQGIWACGDHIDSDFPSTLEGAVRSGRRVVQTLNRHACAA